MANVIPMKVRRKSPQKERTLEEDVQTKDNRSNYVVRSIPCMERGKRGLTVYQTTAQK